MNTLNVQIKELINRKWDIIPTKNLLGMSVLSFVASNDLPAVAAVLEDGKPVMFISNSEEEVIKYKQKGPSFFATDLQELLTTKIPSVIAIDKIFGECKMTVLTFNGKEEEKPKNNLYKPNVSKIAYKQPEIYIEDV